MSESTKLPPHDMDAEESLLGALLLDGSCITQITLEPQDFYYEQNQWVFEACKKLHDRGVSINEVTVSQELNSIEKLAVIGGNTRLTYLMSVCPTSLDARWYADIVHRLSTYRKLISAGTQIVQMGYEAQSDVSNSLNKADDTILGVRKHGSPSPIVTPDDSVKMLNERYSGLLQQDTGVAMATGLRDLDKMLGGGMFKGDFVLVAGRPSMGKTEFLLSISGHVGQKHNVLFCSAEMSVESILDRVVASQCGVPVNRIRLGGYDSDLYCDITGKALEHIRQSQVFYFRDMPMTTDKILQASMAMQLRYGLDLVVIDYLGILDDEYGKSGYERVGYISRKTKQIARMLDIPVLAAHQLNREVEHSTDKRPQLKDLRDSGKLEEDSDVVLLLYRDSYYDPNKQVGETEVIVAKQRQGVANKIVGVYYDAQNHIYRDLETRHEDNRRRYYATNPALS